MSCPGYQLFHHSGFTETTEKSHVIHHDHLLLNLGLLLDVVLSTPLLRLAGVMLMLILGLLGAVSRQACDGTSDGACNPISCPRGEVANLATSLLLLSLKVLLTSGLLQVLQTRCLLVNCRHGLGHSSPTYL